MQLTAIPQPHSVAAPDKVFAFTRSLSIKSDKRLVDLEAHALRTDREAAKNLRPGAIAGAGLDYPSKESRHLRRAYTAYLKRMKAEVRKNAPKMHSVVVGVSSRWVEATGDLHDPDNPRNRELFSAAIAWVKSFAGEDSVVHARMDLDEYGGAVVDVFFAPVAPHKYKGRVETKDYVSTNKCLQALAISLGYSKSGHYQALNTSWAQFAKCNLDPLIVRGTAKSLTGIEYLPTRLYKAEQEAIKKANQAEIAEKNALVQTESARVAEMEASAALQEAYNREAAAEESKELAYEQYCAADAAEKVSKDVLRDLDLLLASPDIWKISPTPNEPGMWTPPVSINGLVANLQPVWNGLTKIVEHIHKLSVEIAARLEFLKRKEAELDAVIDQMEQLRNRMAAEDAAELDRAKRLRDSRSEIDLDLEF